MPRWGVIDVHRARVAAACVALATMIATWPDRPAEAKGSESVGVYVEVGKLNTGLPPTDDAPDLETPQSSLENFMISGEGRDFVRAARSLNLDSVKPDLQKTLGAELARQLKEVIDQQLWFNWSDVPDRPDGQSDDPAIFGHQENPGKEARFSLKLGSLFVEDRDIEIRLERVKPPDGPPVWVFSRQTIEHIPLLYEHYRSSRLESALPTALKETKFARVAAWQWIGFAVTLIVAGVVGWIVQQTLNLGLKRTSSDWARAIAEAIRGPGVAVAGASLVLALVLAWVFSAFGSAGAGADTVTSGRICSIVRAGMPALARSSIDA